MASKQAVAPVRIRNVRRSQWFFRFPLTDKEVALADGVRGLYVQKGSYPTIEGGKLLELSAPICTLVLGDAEAHATEHPPELEIPGEIWAALMREPTQGAAIRGLTEQGEIATYQGNAPPA